VLGLWFVLSMHAYAGSVIVDPPVHEAFTANVVNATPPAWQAVIVGVGIELQYDDNTTEQIADPNANIVRGSSKQYRANQIKCVAKEHVVLNVMDLHGQHLFDKLLTTAPKCLAHADHVLAQAPKLLDEITKDLNFYSINE